MSESKMNDGSEEVIQRIGKSLRMLRVSMTELGLDREIEKAAQAIPDARDRLVYVAAMTEQAAHRALSAIDRAQPPQDSISKGSKDLLELWDKADLAKMSPEAEFLAFKTRTYLESIPALTGNTQKELLEITMAQDFQDLTGQVIKKMNDMIREIEHQLLQVLIDSLPEGSEANVLKRLAENEWEDGDDPKKLLNGPQIKPTAGDAVTNQEQVDSLLDQLGF